MKMSAVKNFIFFHVFPFICNFFYHLLSFVSIVSYLLCTQISVVIQRFTTSEDVCWNTRNVQTKLFFFNFISFDFFLHDFAIILGVF